MGDELAPLIGGIEAGGTKFICAVARTPTDIVEECRIDTATPVATLGAALDFFGAAARHGPLSALGIASFGPVSVRPGAADFGRILATPKAGWQGTDLIRPFAARFGCPVALDTDVNAAALAERLFGAAHGLDDVAYVTIGTGIGAGILVGGRPVHGLMHAEAGHLRPRRHALDPDFSGLCPFHYDCIEGLASGPAILARHGAPLGELGPDHPAWTIEADYLGQLCAALALVAAPSRIVLGGGVMNQARLFPAIRVQTAHWLGRYPEPVARAAAGPDFIVPSGLNGKAGLVGALALAAEAARGHH